jgi:hypothetical protein
MDMIPRLAQYRCGVPKCHGSWRNRKRTASDPRIAQKTKDEMQKRVEALRFLKFNVHTDRVEAIVNP